MLVDRDPQLRRRGGGRHRPPPRREHHPVRRRLQPRGRRGGLPGLAVHRGLRDRGRRAASAAPATRASTTGPSPCARRSRCPASRASRTGCARSRTRRWSRRSPSAGSCSRSARPRTSRRGSSTSYETHPLRTLHEAGVKLTLGSDDPPYFGATIGGEYAVARERFGLEEGELKDDHADGSPGVLRGRCGEANPAQSNYCLKRPTQRIGSRRSRSSTKELRPCADLFIYLLCCFWWRPARWSPPAAPTRRIRRPARRHRHRGARRGRSSRSGSSPTSAASTTARSTSSPTRAWSARSPSSASRPAC